MSLLLLDTTFLIDAERSSGDLDDAIDDDDNVAIAAITVAELLVGVKLASAKRQKARQVYVDEIIESLHIIAYDRNVAVGHADLLVAVRGQGRPGGAHDLPDRCDARASDRMVVTPDENAFADLPRVTTVSHRQRRRCRSRALHEMGVLLGIWCSGPQVTVSILMEIARSLGHAPDRLRCLAGPPRS